MEIIDTATRPITPMQTKTAAAPTQGFSAAKDRHTEGYDPWHSGIIPSLSMQSRIVPPAVIARADATTAARSCHVEKILKAMNAVIAAMATILAVLRVILAMSSSFVSIQRIIWFAKACAYMMPCACRAWPRAGGHSSSTIVQAHVSQR